MSNQNSPLFGIEHTMVPNGIFKILPLSKKFISILKRSVSRQIKELKTTHPDWALVEVVAFVMSDVNKKLTAPMILELVEYIMAEWSKEAIEAAAEPMLLEAV